MLLLLLTLKLNLLLLLLLLHKIMLFLSKRLLLILNIRLCGILLLFLELLHFLAALHDLLICHLSLIPTVWRLSFWDRIEWLVFGWLLRLWQLPLFASISSMVPHLRGAKVPNKHFLLLLLRCISAVQVQVVNFTTRRWDSNRLCLNRPKVVLLSIFSCILSLLFILVPELLDWVILGLLDGRNAFHFLTQLQIIFKLDMKKGKKRRDVW